MNGQRFQSSGVYGGAAAGTTTKQCQHSISPIRTSDRFLVSGLLLQCSYAASPVQPREKSESLLKGTFFAMVRAMPRAVLAAGWPFPGADGWRAVSIKFLNHYYLHPFPLLCLHVWLLPPLQI